jgi:hypothetical protein
MALFGTFGNYDYVVDVTVSVSVTVAIEPEYI